MAHSEAFQKQRRRILLAGVAAVGLGIAGWVKPEADHSGHSGYFQNLNVALKDAEISTPVMVSDRQRLDHNFQVQKRRIGSEFGYRIVVKSLPSLSLLQQVMAATVSHKLMVLHQPFLTQVALAIPDAGILFGKSM